MYTGDSTAASVSRIPILLDEVQCVGTEKRLTDCSHDTFGSHDCTHVEDLVIQCLCKCSPIAIHFRRAHNVGMCRDQFVFMLQFFSASHIQDFTYIVGDMLPTLTFILVIFFHFTLHESLEVSFTLMLQVEDS